MSVYAIEFFFYFEKTRSDTTGIKSVNFSRAFEYNSQKCPFEVFFSILILPWLMERILRPKWGAKSFPDFFATFVSSFLCTPSPS